MRGMFLIGTMRIDKRILDTGREIIKVDHMKKIRKAVPATTENVTVVNNNRYYGFSLSKSGNMRGYITREVYGKGKYVCRCLSCLTQGNGWETWDDDTLHGVINRLIAFATNEYTVYEFDTYRDLMKWLLEEKAK